MFLRVFWLPVTIMTRRVVVVGVQYGMGLGIQLTPN